MEHKLILSGIIVLGCYLWGKIFSDTMRRRRDTLKALVSAISEAESYVAASVPVKEMYRRLSGKGEVGEMFGRMAESEEQNGEKLWASELSRLCITEEDKKPLWELSGMLGKTTSEHQKNAFEICLTALIKQLEAAEGKYEKEGALCRKLGVCAGLLISIFLI